MRFLSWIVFGILLLLTQGVFAGPQVVVDGSKANVRTVTVKGVTYVAAPDIAKAFGKQYQMVGGKIVFGAQGGKMGQDAPVTELGKWAFNGKLRVRVVSVVHDAQGPYGFKHAITIEVSNAFNEAIAMTNEQYGHHVVYLGPHFYKKNEMYSGGINEQKNWPSDLPPGAHFTNTYFTSEDPGDLLILSPTVDSKPLSIIKLKLVK